MGLHSLHVQLNELEKITGTRAISAELELVLVLYAERRMSAYKFGQKVRCSAAGYSILKKRLLGCGVIRSERCTIDKRVTYFSLAPNVFDGLRRLDASMPHQNDGFSDTQQIDGSGEPFAYNIGEHGAGTLQPPLTQLGLGTGG